MKALGIVLLLAYIVVFYYSLILYFWQTIIGFAFFIIGIFVIELIKAPTGSEKLNEADHKEEERKGII